MKLTLKNKTVISFFVNILAGLLFSFPVFSAQMNQDHLFVLDESQSISLVTTENTSLSESHDTPPKFFKSNLTAGNKRNLQLSNFCLNTNYRLKQFRFSEIIRINFCYIDLSYLKDLRTIKMLS